MIPLAALILMPPLAQPLLFDYKDPKEISAVSLTLDSALEPIVGYAKGISGTVHFDPLHPESASGKLAVDVSSVQFANDGYTATARGYALNEKKWPQLFLTIRKVQAVKRVSKTRFTGVVLADFTCRGITKPKRLVVTADYHPGRAEERTGGKQKGDLLILRTRFMVSRRDHGMSEGIPDELVGDRIEVGVAVVGTHVKEEKPEARWEIEVGNRDDPVLAQAERRGGSLTFKTYEGTVGARITSETNGTLHFRLEPNSSLGEIEGELRGDLTGTLHTKEGDVGLRARKVSSFAPRPVSRLKGVGFVGLDLPKMMRETGTAGMAVARIADHEVIELGHFGVTRAGGAEHVGASTLFQTGSMGRIALHLAALRLAADGRLDLGRPIDGYLGTEGIGDLRVTVRDLMRGTTGFPHTKFAGDLPGTTPSLRRSLGVPKAEPGTESVSATNEALLQLILEKATGQPAIDIVAEGVFKRCGMGDSSYAPFPPGAARGHYQGGEPTFDPYHLYSLESGLWTSARDFGKLLSEVLKLLNGRPNAILQPKNASLLTTLDAPKSILGIRKGENGEMYLGGDPYGFFCQFFLRQAKGEGVLVLQNRMMAWQLANKVADAVRGSR